MNLKDIVLRLRKKDPRFTQPGDPLYRIDWPDFIHCNNCGGIQGLSFGYGKENVKVIDPMLAFAVECMKFGKTYLARCDNSPLEFSDFCDTPVECQKRLDSISPPSGVFEDTGWKLAPESNPRRGYRVYHRVLFFDRNLTKPEIDLAIEYVDKVNRPGPFDFSSKFHPAAEGTVIHFRCLIDSGD